VEQAWLRAASEDGVVRALEAVYADVAAQIEARGPACWASGRCCNFDRAGHLLYVTGLEAAYTVARLERPPGEAERGCCPLLEGHLCGAHAIKPLGCRVYFCDRGAQEWQHRLSEHALEQIRRIHDEGGIPYEYAEWRFLLRRISGARFGTVPGVGQ
jgi:Fe-S-cluster containining protein